MPERTVKVSGLSAAAGAPDGKARSAAEAIAGDEDRFNRIDNHFARLEGDFVLVKWMLGFNLAATLGIVMLLSRQ